MSIINNGQYLVLVGGQVIQYLGNNHTEALEYMMTHYRRNMSKKPEAYLVQVQAVLEYPAPIIKTLAHEVMT